MLDRTYRDHAWSYSSLMTITIPSHLTDDELVAALPALAGDERQLTARLVAHLAEMDKRQIFVPAGYSSLYQYCREALGYSEDAAYTRGVAARVARRYPVILEMLADGRLNVTTVKLLAPVLTDSNCDAVLEEAAGASKRDLEKIVARVSPRPDVPSTVRKLATRVAVAPAATDETAVPERPVGQAASAAQALASAAPAPEQRGATPEPAHPPARRPEVKPLAPERYRVQFTIGEETENKLRRLQTLLKREIPNGDPAVLFDRGLDLLLAAVEGRKHGKTKRPRAATDAAGRHPKLGSRHGSRYVPAPTRREVSLRDEERCAFVATDGRRCTERAFLEYHHGPIPFGHGGPPTPGQHRTALPGAQRSRGKEGLRGLPAS